MENGIQNSNDELYWVKHKPNALFTIVPTPDKNFYEWWCIFITAFVKLTPRERSVVAALLKQRQELSKVISSPEILDSQLMSNEVRDRIMEECNITLGNFQVIKSNLIKAGVINENGLNPKVIPRFRKDCEDSFQLLISFKDLQVT